MGGPTVTQLWRAELQRGLRHLAEGHAEEATACFERAFSTAPERAEVCFALGRERLRQGRVEEAEALLRRAWEIDPGFPAAAAALVRCLGIAAGRLDEAERVLADALARHPHEPGLHVVHAELLLRTGRAEEARGAAYRAAHVLTDEGRPATRAAMEACAARAQHDEGRRLLEEGRAEEALFALKRASDLSPGWTAPVVAMAAAFATLGRVARARACLERVLVARPDDEAARALLASLSPDRPGRA